MKKNQRILIICPSNRGTIALCTLNLWKALNAFSGAEVNCVVLYKLPDGYDEFNNLDYCFNSAPSGGVKGLLSIFHQISWLRKIKKRYKPTLSISTLFGASAVNILSGGDEIKIGIFHSPHQQVKAKGRISYGITLLYYKYLFPKLDWLYCVSNEVKRSIAKSFPGISPSKIKVVYNAHDIEKIKRFSQEGIESESENKVFQNKVILYIGRFDRNKAPERALKAYAQSNLPDDINLVFIGGEENAYTDELRSLAKSYGIESRVYFFGKKTNPYKYLARSKALISSSHSEGLPGVMIEALVLKRPVVTTNSSEGIWEIFSCEDKYISNLTENYETENGIITPNSGNDSYDIPRLSEAIVQIVKKNTTEEAASDFIRKVSFESIASQFLQQ